MSRNNIDSSTRRVGRASPLLRSDLITPVLVLRDVGIHNDADVSMRSQVMKTMHVCLFCCFTSASGHPPLGTSDCLPVTCVGCVWCYRGWTTVNAVLAGIPLHFVRRLQSVMNASARLVFASSKCDHITPLLRQSHWLKVSWRIDYKLAVLVYKCLHGLAPSYS